MKNLGGNLVGRAVRGVHHNLQAFEGQVVRKSALAKFNVSARRIVQATGFPEIGRCRPDRVFQQGGFNSTLPSIRQLFPLRTEKLDAVVGKRVVAGADHHAQRGALRTREVGHSRRGNRPQQHHIDARRIETRFQGTFEHVTGNAGVFADQHDGVCLLGLQHAADSMRQTQNEIGCDGALTHCAANAVGAEILACHVVVPDFCYEIFDEF